MSSERTSSVLIRLTVVLAPMVAGCLLWVVYRNHLSAISLFRHAAVTSSQTSTQAQPISAPARDPPSVSPDAIVLSQRPLSSNPAITASVDPDPVASFRQLITPPAETRRPAPQIDPRMLRKIVDRGVATFASSATDAERAKGANLIQIAALVGYPPARNLLARNYPESEAVRSVVPATDAIRYGLDFLKDPAAATADAERVFLSLAQYFSLQGKLDLFAAQVLTSLRGDRQPQLGHRIDTLLQLLSQVGGACTALAGVLLNAERSPEAECLISLGDKLRSYIETAAPDRQQEDARQRGLRLLGELGIR
jgi:hypothetical protein